jgi:Xaa-Pro aminopeptidase
MKSVFISPSLFKKNRVKLALSLKPASVGIFHSNDEMLRSTDQYFPFRQDSDLFYLTGIEQERTILLLAPDYPDANLREVLFIRKPTERITTWEGHKLSVEEASLQSGIGSVKFEDDYEKVLASLLMHAENIYLNLPEDSKTIPELPTRNLRMASWIKERYPAHKYERLSPLMRELRVTKNEEEITLIRESCRITRLAFEKVLKTLKPGLKEYELEAEIIAEFIRNGARGHAFPPIIASGKNACILHYSANSEICHAGDLLLMDFGAEYANYAADCSRTVPVSGRFSARQKVLYDSVLEVFRFACHLIKPGNTLTKVHAEVCNRFGSEHVKLGLYSAEELAHQDTENPLYKQYYMHGTSHFLGLDVHDAGGKDLEFRPGMVLTCEPGIYLPSENTGIRIETNLLITTEGNIDLMSDIPLETADIEKAMCPDDKIDK